MKKSVLALAATASYLLATPNASNDEILKLYNGLPADVKTSVESREPVLNHNDYEAITIKLSKGSESQKQIYFVKDNLIFPDLIDIKTGISYKTVIEDAQLTKALAPLYSKESQDNIIKLGNDKNKPTIVMFTDANCPYCRKELSEIESRLKESNVEMILTSIHEKPGNLKSAMIYKEIKNAKNVADKIKVLRKYYAEDAVVKDNQVDAKDLKKATDLANKYINAGLTAVPFLIEKDKLTK